MAKTKADLEKEIEELKRKLQESYQREDELHRKINDMQDKADKDFVNSVLYKQMERDINNKDAEISLSKRHITKQKELIDSLRTANVGLSERLKNADIKPKQKNERGAGRKRTELNMSIEEIKKAVSERGINTVANELHISVKTVQRRLKEYGQN